MNEKALWNAKGEKTIQERDPAGRGKAARRLLITAGAIVVAALLTGTMIEPLCAQSYPSKPIRLIIGVLPGGQTDVLGRIIAQKLTERLGQPVVVESRPGAAGNIAYGFVAKARPDGYTIGLASSAISISPSLYKKLDYDLLKDFAPIALVATSPYILTVRSSLPVNNLKEFVEYAKANPGKLNYASNGIGTTTQLGTELLKSLAKINLVHVVYKGEAQSIVALLGGEIDLLLPHVPLALPHIQAGKLKALAVLANERLPALPNVPTAKEGGIPNYEVSTTYGILAPAGTPSAIVTRLNAEWFRSAAMPDTREQMQKNDCEPLPPSTPGQLSEFLKAEIARWAMVVKDAKISRID